jgi:ribose transport system substrate-binding protein
VFTRNQPELAKRPYRAWLALPAVAVAAALVLSGCSSKGNASDLAPTQSTDSSSSSVVASGDDVVSKAQDAIKQLTDPNSSLFDYTSVVPTASVPVKKGAKIAIIGATLASPVVKQYCDTVAAAAQLAGLQSSEFDGKFDVGTEAGLVQQAIQQKYDAIVLVGVVPDTIATPIASAKAAGIPVIQYDGYGDTDNGVTDVGIDPVEAGRAVGQWIIADSNGKAKVLAVTFNSGATGGKKSNTQVAQEALISTVEACGGCSVKTKDMTIADMVAPGTPQYVATLRSSPKGSIDYVASGCDTCMVNLGKANTQLGRTEIKVTGGFAVGAAALEKIRTGTDNSMVAPVNPGELIGLLCVDTVLRRLAGQQVNTIAVNAPLVVKENVNDFANATFAPPKDYKAVFAKLWTS